MLQNFINRYSGQPCCTMSPEEFLKEKLATIAELMSRMDDDTVHEFRAACAGKHPGSKEEETVLDVIDGELASREIRRGT